MAQGWLGVGRIGRSLSTERSMQFHRLIMQCPISPRHRQMQRVPVLVGELGLVTSLLGILEQ